MAELDASAFDPIFWLHHCNVDRLWAIWAALNPNSYVEPGAAGRDSFTAKRGTIEDINTPLKPFWDASGSEFWNSAGVKETTTFNYAYPETQKWKFASVADYQRNVRSTVAQLYGTGNVVRDFITINSLPTTNLFATQKAVARDVVSADDAATPVGEAQAPMNQAGNNIPALPTTYLPQHPKNNKLTTPSPSPSHPRQSKNLHRIHHKPPRLKTRPPPNLHSLHLPRRLQPKPRNLALRIQHSRPLHSPRPRPRQPLFQMPRRRRRRSHRHWHRPPHLCPAARYRCWVSGEFGRGGRRAASRTTSALEGCWV